MNRRGDSEHNPEWTATDCREPRLALSNTYYSSYQDSFEDYIAESWLPHAAPSWSRNIGTGPGLGAGPGTTGTINGIDSEIQWSHDSFHMPKQVDIPRQDHGLVLYTEFGYIVPDLDSSPTLSTEYEFASSSSERQAPYQASPDTQVSHEYGPDYHYQPPQPSYHQPASSMYETPFLHSNTYPELNEFVFLPEEHLTHRALSTVDVLPLKSTTSVSTKSVSPPRSSPGLVLDWSVCEQTSIAPRKVDESSYIPAPKRKASYEAPDTTTTTTTTSNWVDLRPKDMTECVDVFENAPGALASVKRRRKLDAPVRKAAREVRKAGACHQCRFRKRTVS
jgi:hypothetical protein